MCRRLRFTFDSDMNRPEKNQPSYYPLEMPAYGVPSTMTRDFRIEALDDAGEWMVIAQVTNNYQRLVRLETDVTTTAIRFIPEATWGATDVHVFAWDIA